MSAPTLARAEARLGTTLRGKYRLDTVLGLGGMGTVYAATHRNTKRFAIKVLHADLSRNDDIRNRFLREGYAANKVGHPGTVIVLDDDINEDGTAFLVMELLEGTPVDALAVSRGGKLGLKTAAVLLDQLLDVLDAAHAKGVIHRDIKPANLFITTAGTLKVLDFGIARARDAAEAGDGVGTTTGTLLGSPAFMSPEQALGQSSSVDAQTDLWAASATLYTLITGRLVHEGDNPTMVLVRAATRQAPPLASIVSSVPASIASVVDRGLAFAKGDRWRSAREMREALRDAFQRAYGPIPNSVPSDDEHPLPAAVSREGAAESETVPFSVLADAGESPLDLAKGSPGPSSFPAASNMTSSIIPGPFESRKTKESAQLNRMSRWWQAIGGASLVALLAALGIRSASGPAPGAAQLPLGSPSVTVHSSRAAAALLPATSALTASNSAPPAPSAIATASARAAASASARAAATASARASTASAGKAEPKPRSERRLRDSARPVAPPPVIDCSPPYSLDSQGNHVFKKECI